MLETTKLVAAAESRTRAGKRTAVPNAIVRLLFARAEHRCERCKSHGGQLHVHHLDPVSDGGTHRLDRLQLLCSPCHSLAHETDYEKRPEWRIARDRKLRSKGSALSGLEGSMRPVATEALAGAKLGKEGGSTVSPRGNESASKEP